MFRAIGLPSHTLIDRSATPAYRDIKFKIGAGGLVSIYGDSKSGKTVLSLKILEKLNPILLHGPHIKNEEMFWSVLAGKLQLGGEHAVTHRNAIGAETRAGLKVSIAGGPAKLEADVGRQDSQKNDIEIRNVFSTKSHDIIDRLIEVARPIVVDDFHAIPKEAQKEIIYKLKPAIDRGIAIVVISVPEQTEEMVQSLSSRGEIAARHAKIEAPLWEPDEIRQIPLKGFSVLNVSMNGAAIEILTKNAYRNPLLMQAYCRRLCYDLGIDRTLPSNRQFDVSAEKVRDVIRRVAEEYRPGYSDYLRLDDDGAGNWKLRSGKSINIYVLVVLALSGIPINYRVKVRTLRERMHELLAKDTIGPSEAVIHNALVKITEQMKGKEDSQAPLRYDSVHRYAFVTHPFFKVFMQWDVLPNYRDVGIPSH